MQIARRKSLFVLPDRQDVALKEEDRNTQYRQAIFDDCDLIDGWRTLFV